MQSEVATKKRNIQAAFMYLVTCFMWFSIYVYVPILSPYCEGMGLSYSMVGVVIGSYGFVQLVCRIPIGILSDTLKKRKFFLMFGLCASLLSDAGFFFVHNPNLLVIFRGLAGLAASTWAIYMTMYLGYFTREEQPKAMGVINSAMSVGQVIATFLGGIIATRISESWTFGVAGVASIVGLAVCAFLPKPDIDKKPLKISDFIETAKNHYLLFFSSMAILLQVAMYAGPFGFVPNILRDIGSSNFVLGLSTTFSSLPAILSAILAGTFFRRKFGTQKTIVMAFAAFALVMIATAFTRNVVFILILQLISGFAKGLLLTLLTSMAIKEIPAVTRSTATAFFQAVYGVGMTFGPILAGWLADIRGMNFSFIMIGLLTMCGAILVGCMRCFNYD